MYRHIQYFTILYVKQPRWEILFNKTSSKVANANRTAGNYMNIQYTQTNKDFFVNAVLACDSTVLFLL